MKNKLAMRIASLALCVVFTGMLFGAPKSKAVATEVAVGTAAVASYFQATGLTMAASAGSTGALITTGVADIAGSYAMATGAASSGSAFLSSVAAGVSISPAGALVLTAAAVVAIGALVAWYIGANGLDAEGASAVAVLGSSDTHSYNGVVLPDIASVWTDKESLPYAYIVSDGSYYRLHLFAGPVTVNGLSRFDFAMAGGTKYAEYTVLKDDPLASGWTLYNSGSLPWRITYSYTSGIWSNVDVFSSDGSLALAFSTSVPAGNVQNQLEITRAPEFIQPDIELDAESQKQMIIDAGLSHGITLDAAVEQVPELIASGTLAPTYEITISPGEGTDPEPEPEPELETAVVPLLQRIQTTLSGLATSIADKITTGLKSLFVPSDAALDSLSSEVDEKLPIIPTLQGFGENLVYNLEHPEKCADGLGLTTIVDLEKGRGTYLGNTKHDLLNVTWYLEYKPLVDDIIVGFCWLVFLWNCYGALPRIIHGEGSVITVDAMDFPPVGAGSGVKELGKRK